MKSTVFRLALAIASSVWAVVLAGCSSSGAAAASHGSPGAPAGGGTVAGAASGHPTTKVAAAYFIGQSDDPANTIVVYLFDAPVACGDLGAPGWDAKILDQTGALEMKLLGTTAGSYPVSATPNGKAGEALVNFTVTSTSATPTESVAKSGSVVVDSLDPTHRTEGSYSLTFSDGTLTGTFDAAFCANGHEP